MAQKFLKISPLEAHYLLSLLKTSRPRKKYLKAESEGILSRLSTQLTAADPKEMIADSVRQAIRNTIGNQSFSDTTTLESLLFDNPTYTELAAKLTVVAQGHEPTANISRIEVIAAKTVGGCITLTQTKAGLA